MRDEAGIKKINQARECQVSPLLVCFPTCFPLALHSSGRECCSVDSGLQYACSASRLQWGSATLLVLHKHNLETEFLEFVQCVATGWKSKHNPDQNRFISLSVKVVVITRWVYPGRFGAFWTNMKWEDLVSTLRSLALLQPSPDSWLTTNFVLKFVMGDSSFTSACDRNLPVCKTSHFAFRRREPPALRLQSSSGLGKGHYSSDKPFLCAVPCERVFTWS